MGELVTVYVVLGWHYWQDEPPFVAKVFSSQKAAHSWADAQAARQHEIVYSVNERWVDDGSETEFKSE